MFKRTKELQSLVNASRKALREAESKIENRNILIKDMEEQALVLYEEKKQLLNENADLRSEKEELKHIIRTINQLMTCNQYNNEKTIKNKIIELTSDYQSIC